MSHFGIYLTDNKGKTIELPIAPSDLKAVVEMQVDTQNISKMGEMSVVGHSKPQEIELTVLIPRNLSQQSPHITARQTLASDKDYIKFVKDWCKSKGAGRILVTTTDINFACQITSYETNLINGDDTVWQLVLKIKEHRGVQIRRIKTKTGGMVKSTAKRASSGKLCVGVSVIANGRVHLDSYGRAPGIALSNYRGKINLVAPGRSHPWHVTAPDGKHLGWMTNEAVRMV